MYRLSNTIRNYAWGTADAISELLGLDSDVTPQAEMWLGAHPGSPSQIIGLGRGLNELICEAPADCLGEDVRQRYGQLPYLLKVLAAAKPLSIQSHPSLEQARQGFAAEEAAGVPVDAGHRNYKDANHKPEMIYALTEYVALSGFRQPSVIAGFFDMVRPLLGVQGKAGCDAALAALHGEDPLADCLALLLSGDPAIALLVDEVVAAVGLDPELAADEALAETVRIAGHYPSDPGVLVSLMLNLVHLQPGEVLYLDAGNLHAYLRGVGIELMANSDNVLRGGLTSKHVDVAELLKVTRSEAAEAPRLEPTKLDDGSLLFTPPFEEFALQVIDTELAGESREFSVAHAGGSIILCTQGVVELRSGTGEPLVLERGESAFLPAKASPVRLSAADDAATQAFVAGAQTVAG